MNLKQKISAVLSQAHYALTYEYNNGHWECNSEALRMLRALYAVTALKLKPNFCPLLVKYLTTKNAKHVCHAILDIAGAKGMSPVLTSPMTRAPIVEQFLKALEERLRFEPDKFSELDLDELEVLLRHTKKITYMAPEKTLNAVLDLFTTMHEIGKQFDAIRQGIQRARYAHVKRELFEGINPEINTDKEALLSRMVTLGFRGSIAAALEEVEKKLANAASAFDFKGVMDLIRTIYEEVFEDAANSVANRRTKTIPQGSHFGRFKTFLIGENVLSGEEGKLSQELYNYLSNCGSHVLGSAPEQVRLTKNIVIELCLLVLGRVQGPQSSAHAGLN